MNEQNTVNFKRSLLCKVRESSHEQKLAADEAEALCQRLDRKLYFASEETPKNV